ncbi:uncharacterized protein LOC143465254 [Clavelina lepadiformis]|uniref:uncharacterized protein LOC143465254 n=1 Tax=Clavelina lepadiformis TaxID=159417 RepID=UPI004041C556
MPQDKENNTHSEEECTANWTSSAAKMFSSNHTATEHEINKGKRGDAATDKVSGTEGVRRRKGTKQSHAPGKMNEAEVGKTQVYSEGISDPKSESSPFSTETHKVPNNNDEDNYEDLCSLKYCYTITLQSVFGMATSVINGLCSHLNGMLQQTPQVMGSPPIIASPIGDEE